MRYDCLRTLVRLSMFLVGIAVLSAGLHAGEFSSNWHVANDRVWIGPEYWANPMEDWKIAHRRLVCTGGSGRRTVHLLSREVGPKRGNLEMVVVLGPFGKKASQEAAGFSFGIQSEIDDYRSRVFHGRGIDATISADGTLRLGSATRKIDKIIKGPITLGLIATPEKDGYRVKLFARGVEADPERETVHALGELGMVELVGVPAEKLVGNVALVRSVDGKKPGPAAPFSFKYWMVSGSKVEEHPERAFGPILWAMHTLSRGVLKMTAQMPPLGIRDSKVVHLAIRQENGEWKLIASEFIDPKSRTATFRIANWDSSRDVEYRLHYAMTTEPVNRIDRTFNPWTGFVRKDPVDQDSVVVAGFTGNTDTGFPNREIVRNVGIQDPDVLFFSGDQIYENVGGYGIVRSPTDRAILNYLRKWYMFGWAFGDLMRDRVTICLPDDHDVYQGNVWGQGGIDCGGIRQHDAGGYAMHPDFVNVVHRTQTAHHPDPFDPTPMAQGISVYYGDMVYGRISFAVIADRMFKSGPKGKVDTGPGRADHVMDRNFDVISLDKPGLKLLGDRQLKFLRHWGADWKGADMKIVLSQTIFCNLANYHGAGKQFIFADLDSNGWPQSGRNKALEEIRRGMALHFAGDQHLPSIVHHGIDKHNDAGYSFCVPSIAAGYPRSWLPDKEGRPVVNRPEGGLPNTGEYFDGLKNRITVHAIGNPARENRPGRLNTLHDKSSGYGIVRMNKPKRTMTMECWRLLFDAANPKPSDQFPGWPKTIEMTDNYAKEAVAYLPEITVVGLDNPVIQIVDQTDGQIVYTLRIAGNKFRPKVFSKGKYTVIVSEPDSGKTKTLKDVEALNLNASKRIEVKF